MSVLPQIDVSLHKKQGDVLHSPANEILYGGAAGGGKSHLMRILAIILCASIPGLQVYLFRRIREDLIKNHLEGPQGFRVLLAPWEGNGFVKIVGDDEIRFWNGAKIWLCHCKDEKDRFKYQGAEIHVLLIDELTHFTEVIYRFLRGRLRAPGLKVPEQYKDVIPRIIAGSNPGNIGHQWVKQSFVDGGEMTLRRMPKEDGGMLRQYIPARLSDNPSMAKDDPSYEDRLSGLGSDSLVRAMKDGDWGIIEGAFFECWRKTLHDIRPFEIPQTWTRFRSGDWGSAKPFSFGWWALVQDDYQHDGVILPRGAMVRYREFYGCKKNADGTSMANVGLKMPAESVGERLAEIERHDGQISYGVLDPAAFSSDGGPSIAERIYKGSGNKVMFRRADNARVSQKGAMGGWDQLRARLIGEEDTPMIYTFTTCLDSIRTIPVLQHDTDRPEDLNSDMEDHAADEWRYACMSRPYVRTVPKKEKPRFLHEMTASEVFWPSTKGPTQRTRL
jgi:hypothetical protein